MKQRQQDPRDPNIPEPTLSTESQHPSADAPLPSTTDEIFAICPRLVIIQLVERYSTFLILFCRFRVLVIGKVSPYNPAALRML